MVDRASVLVVEDDPDLMLLVADVLAHAGFAARTAPDGLAGLAEVADHGMPDLILLDMRMPRMNGEEFARELRRRHADAAPLIVMTAAVNARQQAAQIGAVAWLAKPFELEHLVAAVRRIVGPQAPVPSCP